jgi:hypothetical protein
VAIAWASLALGGCKAEFTSGVTVCGEKEPRCPSGFVCVNGLRCVKMGDVNVDRTDGGSAGGQEVGGMVPSFTPPVAVDAAPLLDAAPPPPDATAVASDAGATAIDAAAGPDMAPIPVGQAVVKFCNGLRRVDGNSLELELVIGSVRFKAGTRQCVPAPGMACSGLPAGPVTAQLFRDGMMVATKQLTLDQSGQYLIGPNVDGPSQTYGIDATKLAVGQVCGNFAFPDVAKVKFCNRLATSDAMGNPVPVVLDLVIGTAKLTAGTGQCSTMEGLACAEVRAGMAKLSLQRNGMEATSVMTTLSPDGNYAVLGEFDLTTKGPKLTVIPLPASQTCPAYKPPPLPAAPPPSDGGTGG